MKLSSLPTVFLPIALLTGGLLLSACNKSDNTAAVDTAPAKVFDLATSPTVQLMTIVFQEGTMSSLLADANDEQKKCLQASDGEIYREAAKNATLQTLGEENIKLSDAFYETEVGQKMFKYMKQEITGIPANGTQKIEITAEDQAQMQAFAQSEIGQKAIAAQASQQKADSAAMTEIFMQLAQKEQARCQMN